MYTILNIKPSEAVFAMVEGLKYYREQENFKIKMSSYGEVKDKVCFGCAATCAVQYLYKHNFTLEEIGSLTNQANALNLDKRELCNLEIAIEDLRSGCPLFFLLNFMGRDAASDVMSTYLYPTPPSLNDDFTDDQLDHYLHFANWLKDCNL